MHMLVPACLKRHIAPLPTCLADLCLQVVSRMETADHWVTYAEVVGGEVTQPDQRTAVHRRKVANYY